MFGALDDPPSLRQGDIIESLFFPVPRQPSVQFLSSRVGGDDVNLQLQPIVQQPPGARRSYLSAIVPGFIAHAAVVSQCCDLDRTHPKTSFVVCRIMPLDRTRYRNLEALIANVDPYGEIRPHLQFFCFGPINGLEGEYLADFSLTLTVPWNDYDALLRKKIAQLDQLNRNKFRVKVGAHYGRPTPEDADAGFANPYLGVPS